MGGDIGPEVVVKGALEAVRKDPEGLGVVLVGDRRRIESVLERERSRPSNVEVVHASEAVDMSEAPAGAIRKKKDSSIAVALRMLKERSVDGLVSAGNTGAVVAGALPAARVAARFAAADFLMGTGAGCTMSIASMLLASSCRAFRFSSADSSMSRLVGFFASTCRRSLAYCSA